MIMSRSHFLNRWLFTLSKKEHIAMGVGVDCKDPTLELKDSSVSCICWKFLKLQYSFTIMAVKTSSGFCIYSAHEKLGEDVCVVDL